jgi:hypothetical protein
VGKESLGCEISSGILRINKIKIGRMAEDITQKTLCSEITRSKSLTGLYCMKEIYKEK